MALPPFAPLIAWFVCVFSARPVYLSTTHKLWQQWCALGRMRWINGPRFWLERSKKITFRVYILRYLHSSIIFSPFISLSISSFTLPSTSTLCYAWLLLFFILLFHCVPFVLRMTHEDRVGRTWAQGTTCSRDTTTRTRLMERFLRIREELSICRRDLQILHIMVKQIPAMV